jgi:hypothetical protein
VNAFFVVMAGLVPAISICRHCLLIGMPGTQASEATPFFERLWPGMTARGVVDD